MFVFDLFEKKKQDAAAGRFVGGTSQDARVKNALDNAYRAVPAAKSPEEAALGYIDIQNSLNQKQDQALAQQSKTNQQQTQQINDLVNDMRRKEKDFRDLNAQIANMPNVTPQQAAKMAQDIEAAHSSDKGEPVDVSNVVAKQTAAQPAKAVAAPSPGASVSQLANYQKAKDQGAATAKPATKAQPAVSQPQATAEPATSKALGQMATQLTQPQSRVYKAKQPAQQELPVNNVTQMPSTPAAQQRLQQLSNLGLAANSEPYQQVANMEEATSVADVQAIAQHNNQAFSQAWAHSQSTKLYFGDGQWEDLTFQEVEQMVSAIATDYTEQARPQVWQQLFTDHNYFKEFKAQHLSQLPLQFKEGEVIPMTGSPKVPGNVKAYQYALEILKAAFDERVPTGKIDQMKQVLFHDFQARIQQAPDGTYYLNANGVKSRLPDPRTFPMEEDSWHNSQNDWSSEHDQWAKESVEETRLTVGDPVVVTAPNEFEGKTGEIDEFSPSGKFVIVNLYNHGRHSMHLSDVEYNKYADKQDEIDEHIGKVKGGYRLYSKHGSKNLGTFPTRAGAEKHEREVQYFKHAGEGVEEGWSDKMVAQRTGRPRTPYSVYIKGKKWKDFANDDHARAVMDKLKAKFAADGRDPETVTIAPTDMAEAIVASGPSQPLDDRAVRKLVWDTMKINADTGEQAIQRALAVLAKKPQSRMVQDLQDKFQGLADRLAQGVLEADSGDYEYPYNMSARDKGRYDAMTGREYRNPYSAFGTEEDHNNAIEYSAAYDSVGEQDVAETVWFPTVNVPKFPKPEVDDTNWVVTYKIPATGETKIVAVAGDTEEQARENLLARNPTAKIVSVKQKGVAEAISRNDLLKQVGDKLNDPEFRKQPADPTKRWERGDLYQGPGPDDYGYTGYQGHGMPTDRAERARIRADKKKGVAEMDKSQKGAAGWNIDDYPLGAKGTTAKPTTVKNVVKTATKDLDAAFNSPEQLKKDADYRAYRKGVKQSRKEKPAPLDEFAPTPMPSDNDDLSTEAQKDGFRIGASSVDGMPLDQAFGYTHWDEKYKLAFSSGWVKGRKFKIKNAKNDGVDLVLQKNGSLARAQVNEFAPGGGYQEPPPPVTKKKDPFDDDDRSIYPRKIQQLLTSGAKVDSRVPGAMGHIIAANGEMIRMKPLNKPHSQKKYAWYIGQDRDDKLLLKQVEPNHYVLYDRDWLPATKEVRESTNYWTKLQNERNTKIASLVNELTESVKDIK